MPDNPLLQRESPSCDREEYLSAAIDNIIEGIIIINEDRIVEMFNPAAERIFGYAAAEVVGRNVKMLMPEPFHSHHDNFVQNYLRTGVRKVIGIGREVRARRQDGSIIPIYLAVSEMRPGKQRRFVGVIRDISDIRQAEAARRESEARFRTMADSANYTIISTTTEGIITTFNTAAERWLGYAAAEMVGKQTPASFHDPEEVKARAAGLSRELGVPVEPGFEVFVAKARLGEADEREWTYIRKDGSRFPVLLSITALRQEDGEITGFLGIGSDITERQRAQEAVNRLAAIVEFSADAIIGKTLDGVIVSWNQGAERMYGYAAAEMLGRHISVLFPPDRQDELASIFAGLRQGQRIQNYETVRIRKDGRSIDVSLTISPIRNAEGNIAGISTIARDITESKKAEVQLRQLSRAVEQSPASVVITDPQGIIQYVNPKFTRITGYTAEEAIGQNPRILKSGDKKPEEYQNLWETITAGEEWRGEFHNKKKNGELYWESASISPIKDDKGIITHFIAVKEDITAIKAAREELAKLSLVASKTDNAVIITDKDGVIEWVNDGFARLTGYTLEETVGKKPGSVLQGPASDSDTIKLIGSQLRARQPLTAELINYHKSGRPYWVAMDITPIFDDKGELTRFISIERDITQRKETEEALNQAKKAADAANRAKSEFLASMSHEIRTPMNAIIGMADLLWETALTQEQQQYVEVFRSAGETLLNLINDILDLSKVEAGQITLERIDLDLAGIVEKVCEVMALKAHQKGLELACRIMPGVPTHLLGDPVRLRQILTNLVGNSIKFTEAGEVVVEVNLASEAQCPKDPAVPCPITFAIKDTGIGISPEKLEVIFDKFTQADNSTTRKYGGSGLGLAISKHLVELMGGELQVRSQVGQGSTFEFTIPCLRQLEPQDKPSVPAADLKDLRVLVVDDNATNRLILREIMTGWGARVAEAENGIQGLAELARAQKEGQPYQLVLLDGRMPQMDGFGMAEAIHCDAGFSSMTVMMLTSDARSGDLSRARDLGLASYLVKPVKRHDLREAIDRSLHRAFKDTSTVPAAAPVAPEAQRPLRILLADDSADNRLLIQAYLKKYPFELDLAEDGEQALGKFQAGSYDLVLMDMQMPVLDGYNATRRIREWERQQQVPPTPVIALTAYALKEEIQKSLDAGCTVHLTKPIKKSVLLEAIAQYSRSSGGE
jgi:PAS domain S-box-containing protein